jgi:hypothetical protein
MVMIFIRLADGTHQGVRADKDCLSALSALSALAATPPPPSFLQIPQMDLFLNIFTCCATLVTIARGKWSVIHLLRLAVIVA